MGSTTNRLAQEAHCVALYILSVAMQRQICQIILGLGGVFPLLEDWAM